MGDDSRIISYLSTKQQEGENELGWSTRHSITCSIVHLSALHYHLHFINSALLCIIPSKFCGRCFLIFLCRISNVYDFGEILTAFSLPDNAFHSCPINFPASGTFTWRKSPLAYLSLTKETYDVNGRFTCRSSFISGILCFKWRLSCWRARFAALIWSGVYDDTHFA